MNVHKNARLTPEGRALMVNRVVDDGWSVRETASSFHVSETTVRKWVRRYRAEGDAGLYDRSSRPHGCPHRTGADVVRRIVSLRRVHHLTSVELAKVTDVPRSTVGRYLRRHGISRLRSLKTTDPVQRYERASPGELLHVDIKKLPRFEAVGHRITGNRSKVGRKRGVGWDFVHVAIDDHSRVAYAEVLEDERGATATSFIERALDWFEERGVHTERLMTDNGSCYRSRAFNQALAARGVRHIYTRPYTPKTNGKAERFIGTMAREWAYARAYPNSIERNRVLDCWMKYYNHMREHSSINHNPPASRLPSRNNLVGNHN